MNKIKLIVGNVDLKKFCSVQDIIDHIRERINIGQLKQKNIFKSKFLLWGKN